MAGETDRLVQLCREAAPLYDPREYDVVVASGEQVTSGLLAIIAPGHGRQRAHPSMGWQLPIRASAAMRAALIDHIDAEIARAALFARRDRGHPGFPGRHRGRRVATLGRGGSDTSAVALAAAMKADRCDIYTDVDGVYTTDPRIVPRARKLEQITYEEMLELASVGAKVLQTRSVGLAMKDKAAPGPVLVRGRARHADRRRRRNRGMKMERQLITGIAHDKNEAQGHADRPARPARRRWPHIFAPLADGQHQRRHDRAERRGRRARRPTSPSPCRRRRSTRCGRRAREGQGRDRLSSRLIHDTDVVKVSVGRRRHAQPTRASPRQMFETLAERGINILAIIDLGDQGLGADRRRLYRARRARPAHRLWASTRSEAA